MLIIEISLDFAAHSLTPFALPLRSFHLNDNQRTTSNALSTFADKKVKLKSKNSNAREREAVHTTQEIAFDCERLHVRMQLRLRLVQVFFHFQTFFMEKVHFSTRSLCSVTRFA